MQPGPHVGMHTSAQKDFETQGFIPKAPKASVLGLASTGSAHQG